jgi:hypothetical protein
MFVSLCDYWYCCTLTGGITIDVDIKVFFTKRAKISCYYQKVQDT